MRHSAAELDGHEDFHTCVLPLDPAPRAVSARVEQDNKRESHNVSFYCRSGVGKLRPGGHMQHVKLFNPAMKVNLKK